MQLPERMEARMVESERVRMIAALVAARGFAAVRDLTEATGASPATLRRDLAKLAAAGAVRRVFSVAGASRPEPAAGVAQTALATP